MGLSSVEQHIKPYECYTNGMKEQYWDFLWQTSSVNKSSIAGELSHGLLTSDVQLVSKSVTKGRCRERAPDDRPR